MKTSELMWIYNDKESTCGKKPHNIFEVYFSHGTLFCSDCECAVIDHEPVGHTYSARQIEFVFPSRVSVGFNEREDLKVEFDKWARGRAVEENTW